MVRYDFGTTEEVTRPEKENLPEGECRFRVTHAEEKKSAAGNDMIVLTCRPDLEDADRYWDVKDYVVFSAGAMGITKRKLKALGFKVPGDGSPFTFDEQPVAFFNREFIGMVKHEENNGKMWPKIAWMNPVDADADSSSYGTEKAEIPF